MIYIISAKLYHIIKLNKLFSNNFNSFNNIFNIKKI